MKGERYDERGFRWYGEEGTQSPLENVPTNTQELNGLVRHAVETNYPRTCGKFSKSRVKKIR